MNTQNGPSYLPNLNPALPADLDDIELMRLINMGSTPALAQLYDRHASLLYSVLMQKLEDSSEAQDTVHDVFVKLHTKSHLYNPALGKPVAWLLTMARNTATDKLRKRSTHQKYVNKAIIETDQSSPAHVGLHGDELEVLRNCLSILPNQQQNILQLAYFSGLTQQEIASQLDQPLGSVKAWIRRGLIKLRDCVGGKL
jgi:RNA polymerase sigma-70 factor, ECF subfamily